MVLPKLHLMIQGKVQGVGFRYHTSRKAKALGLKGWVRNTREGHVECVAVGEESVLEIFLKWCWEGSPASKVTAVEIVERGEAEPFTDFFINETV